MSSWLRRAALAPIHALHVAYRGLRHDGSRLTILMYHGVVAEPLAPYCWHQLPVAQFERQMRFVAKTCHPLPLAEALERMAAGTLPRRACAITFDDGFLNNKTHAYPILRALGLPATIFLVTGALERREVLWPDRLYLALQRTSAHALDASDLGLGTLALDGMTDRATAIRRLLATLKELPAVEKNQRLDALLDALPEPAGNAAGPFALLGWDDVDALAKDPQIEFGAHTTQHEMLSRLADEDVAREIRLSIESVEARTGRRLPVFAYPNGRAQDFDGRAQRELQALGVPWALCTREGVARRGEDPFQVPRIGIGADLPFDRFRHLVAGTIDLLRRARPSRPR